MTIDDLRELREVKAQRDAKGEAYLASARAEAPDELERLREFNEWDSSYGFRLKLYAGALIELAVLHLPRT